MTESLATLFSFCITFFIFFSGLTLVLTVGYVFINILCEFVLKPIDNFFERLRLNQWSTLISHYLLLVSLLLWDWTYGQHTETNKHSSISVRLMVAIVSKITHWPRKGSFFMLRCVNNITSTLDQWHVRHLLLIGELPLLYQQEPSSHSL